MSHIDLGDKTYSFYLGRKTSIRVGLMRFGESRYLVQMTINAVEVRRGLCRFER